jgi:hypothetical protein
MARFVHDDLPYSVYSPHGTRLAVALQWAWLRPGHFAYEDFQEHTPELGKTRSVWTAVPLYGLTVSN